MSDSTERQVAGHYTHGALERAILDALAASGAAPDRLTTADLAPVDEFHIGGREATIEFAAGMGIRPGMHLLDIGSGLGGASRHFAEAHGCRVSGIDLTEEYVRVAGALAGRVGLGERVSYRQGSALALPFDAGTFDGAYMLHVGMNIADKAGLFREVRRTLKSGGVFGIYDVMREGDGDLLYPVPWAGEPGTSFVETCATYMRLLEAAGFEVRHHRSRREFAIAFFQRMRDEAAQRGGPPPLGLHILLGPSAPEKGANMLRNLEQGLIAPTEIISRAR